MKTKILLALSVLSFHAFGQVPSVAPIADQSDFPGNTVCTSATLTNTGDPGFGPYLRVIVPTGLSISSSNLFGQAINFNNVGVFGPPPPPSNELIDPITGDVITGNENDTFYVLQPPIGSVVSGGVPLDLEVCFDIDPTAPVNTAVPVEITPVYEFGDTATGDNGPVIGAPISFNVTPILVVFNKQQNAPESERPPGPDWPVTYTLTTQVASNNTVDAVVINDVLPAGFVLDVSSINVVGGNNCTLQTSNPLNVTCDSIDGTGGTDLTITYTGYFGDILNANTCAVSLQTNNATFNADFSGVAIPQETGTQSISVEHLTIQKSVDDSTLIPSQTVTFTLNIQLNEYATANNLQLTDVLPDGYTFQAGSETSSLGAISAAVANNVPSNGQTTLDFDLTGIAGNINGGSPAITVTYQAQVDQTYFNAIDPILASDELTNTVNATYGLTGGASSCDNASAVTTIIDPVLVSKEVLNPQPFYMPGDTVTYRLSLAVPSGDTNGVVFADFLPLPVFDATTVNTTYGVDVTVAPTDTLGLVPISIVTDGTTNSVTINWPDIDTNSPQVLAVDLAVTIVDSPFADNLSLSNLLQVRTENSGLIEATAVAPVLILVRAPDLTITKGVLAADQGTIAPLPAVLPVAGNLIGADANDSITYQITVENTGGADAHNVLISDPVVPGLTACSIDAVTDGTGAPLTYTGDLATGISLTNPLPANDDNPIGGGAPFSTDTALVNITCAVAADAVFNSTYTNTATVTYAAVDTGPSFPTQQDSATFTTTSPVIDKTILQVLPDVDGVPGTITVGETIQYQVVITLPEGQGNNAQLVDLLDNGLVFQNFNSLTPSTGLVSSVGFPTALANASLLGTRNGLIDFGTVNNNNNNNGTPETITVVYTVLVEDSGAISNGVQRNNRADFITDTSNDRDRAPNRTVTEPSITMNKSAAPSNADAGDVITYTITVTNNGNSPAFDVALEDLLADPDLSLVATSVVTSQGIVTTGNTAGDTTVLVDIGTLGIGASASITFSATLSNTVISGDSVSNTATVTNYNSIPGGGRIYPDVDDTAVVSIAAATTAKTVLGATSTEQSDGISTRGDVNLVDLTIGEEVTFEITTTLAEGVSPSVIITDNLPNDGTGQMEYVSASVFSVGSNLTPTIAAPPPVPSGTSSVSFDFGSVTNAEDGSVGPEDEIVILVTGRVTDIANNVGIEELINRVQVQFNTGLNATAEASIEVVEPVLTIDKTSTTTTADAGDTITFVMTVDNLLTNNTSANAFDVTLTDNIPAGLTFAGNLTTDSGLAPTTLSQAAGIITATWTNYPIGSVTVISFDVTVDNSVAPDQMIQNTAEIEWTSLPGVSVHERTRTDDDAHSITIGETGLDKAVIGTSEPSTGTSVNGGEDDLTIGEEVTYQFIVTLPEGTTPNAVVTDQLPTVSNILSVVSSRIVSIGGRLTPTSGTPGDAGIATDSDLDSYDDRVQWFLGDVFNNPDGLDNSDDQLLFEVVALVVDEAINQGGANDVVNTATLSYTGGSIAGTALVDLVEPRLNVSKATVPVTVLADAGDTIDFRITIDHIPTSTADAFSLVLTDMLPSPGVSWIDDSAVNFSSTCGAVVNSTGDPNIVFTINQLALSTGSCTIDYKVTVDLEVKPGTSYSNNVELQYDSTPVYVAGATRRTLDAASASFNIGVPSIEKTVTSTSLNDTGTGIGDMATEDLAIGELVDYTITITVPEGTSNNATLQDNVPVTSSGGAMEIVSAAVTFIGNNISTTLPGTPGLSNTDGDGLNDQVLFDFGNIINTPDMVVNQNDQIRVTVTARITDNPVNSAVETLINDALFTYGLNGFTISDSADVELVEPNLGLSKSMGAPVGLVVPIQLILNNTGGTASAYDLTLVDVLSDSMWDLSTITATSIPSGFNFAVTPGPGAGESTVTITSTGALPDSSIEPNEVLIFGFTAEIRSDIPFPTSIVNTVTLTEASSLPGVDPGERDYSDLVATDTLQLAALNSTKTDALLIDNGTAGQANPGDTLRYTVVIENSGNGDATSVVFSDAPDANTTLVVGSVTTTLGTVTTGNSGTDGAVVVDIGTLVGNSTVTITFDVTIDNPFPQAVTEISNQGLIESNEFPPFDTDDPDTVADDDPTITPIDAGHDLTVSKDDGGVTAMAGDTVIYLISYANIGDQNSTGVVLTETVPNNSTFNASSSTAGWTCPNGAPSSTVCTLAVGNLAGGSSGTANFAIDVFDPKPSGVTQILNTVTIADDGNNGPEDDTSNNSGQDTTPIDAAPDLSIIKTSSGANVSPGDVLVYTLSYQNIGTQDATGVVITDAVPNNTSFNAAGSTAGWSCANNDPAPTACSFNLGSVAAGAPATAIQFAVNILNPLPSGVTQISNTASIADDGNNGADTDPSNNSDDESNTVVAVPDLIVSKDDGGITVGAGDTIPYTISYQNIGNQEATGVVLTETVPANTAFNAGSSDAWVCTPNINAGSSCTLAVGAVLGGGAGGTATFAVDVVAPKPSGVTMINNTVSIADDGNNGAEDTSNNSGSDNTPVEAAPDLTITKTAQMSVIDAGQVLIYDLVYANIGTQDATGVVITETVPVHSTFNLAGSTAGWSCADNSAANTTCTLNVGSLAAGAPALTVQFAVNVIDPLPSGADQIINSANIADDGNNGADTDPNNNSDGDSTTIGAAPDLLITKTDVADPVTAGNVIVYQLGYQNIGNQDATGVVITETVPVYTTFDAAGSTAGWSCANGAPAATVCTFNVGAVAAGDPAQVVLFAAAIDDPLTDGVELVNNSASIADDGNNGADADPSNNSDDESNTVVAVPDLIVSKDDGGITVGAGDTIPYTISYQNIGNQEATGVVLTETVPANTAFNAGSSDAWVCTPNINAGSSCTLAVGAVLGGGAGGTATFAVDVVAPKPSGVAMINNTVSIADDGNNGAEDTSNNSGSDNTPVEAAPDLTITKTAQMSVIDAGQVLIYDLVYANIGTQDATGVVITETVPVHSTFNLAGSTAGWSCADNSAANTTCTLNVGSLAAGAPALTVQFAVNVIDPLPSGADQIINTASIADDGNNGADTDPNNNSDGDSTTIGAAPDLLITKTDVSNLVDAGGVIVYQLSYQNIGNQDATGVVITETVPNNTTFNLAASTNGWSCADNAPAASTCTLAVGAVAAGDAAVVVQFAVNVPNPIPAGVDTVTNYVSIGDDGNNGDDADPTNNDDDEDTTIGAFPDLSISKTDNDVTAGPGDVAVYLLTYANNGTQDATGVIITETVPVDTTYNAAGSTAGWSCLPSNAAGSICTFTVGNLNVGVSGSLNFAVQVDDPLPTGVNAIFNTVSIEDDGSNGDDSNPDDNSDDEQTSVLLNPPVGIKVGSLSAHDPYLIEWTFYWFNPYNNRDLPVFIFDPIPASTQYVAGSGSCTATGSSTCSVPTYNSSLNQLELTATIAPDMGAPINATVDQLNNEVVITFETRVVGSVNGIVIANQALANWDEDNDGDPNNDANDGQPPVVTDAPETPEVGDPTLVRSAARVPTLDWWSLLTLIGLFGATFWYRNRRRGLAV